MNSNSGMHLPQRFLLSSLEEKFSFVQALRERREKISSRKTSVRNTTLCLGRTKKKKLTRTELIERLKNLEDL